MNAVKGAVKDVVLLVAGGPVNKTDQRNLEFFFVPPKIEVGKHIRRNLLKLRLDMRVFLFSVNDSDQ